MTLRMSSSEYVINQTIRHTRPRGFWGTTQLDTHVTDSDTCTKSPDDEQNEGIIEEDNLNDNGEDDEDFDLDLVSDTDSDEDSDIDSDEACCRVCFDTTDTQELSCCDNPVCDACLRIYFDAELMAGKGRIDCPVCSKPLGEDFVDGYLSDDSKLRLIQNKVDISRDPDRKTCPCCRLVTDRSEVPNVSKRSNGVPVKCCACDFQWCFECHGPYHDGKTCSNFSGKGDAQLNRWAKRYQEDQKNARICPGCKGYVQLNYGCNNMDCWCGTQFCYKCGKINGSQIRCRCDWINVAKDVTKRTAFSVGFVVAFPVVVGLGIAGLPIITVVIGTRRIKQAIKNYKKIKMHASDRL